MTNALRAGRPHTAFGVWEGDFRRGFWDVRDVLFMYFF